MFLTLRCNDDFDVDCATSDRIIGNLAKTFLTLEDAFVVEQLPKFLQKNSSTLGKNWQIFSAGRHLMKSPSTWSPGWKSEVSIDHPQKLHLDFHTWQS